MTMNENGEWEGTLTQPDISRPKSHRIVHFSGSDSRGTFPSPYKPHIGVWPHLKGAKGRIPVKWSSVSIADSLGNPCI